MACHAIFGGVIIPFATRKFLKFPTIYETVSRYQSLKGKPVQVTDPDKVEMLKKLMGPYHLYRQTEWFRHDHEYERDPYENLSRGFLGLPSKRKG